MSPQDVASLRAQLWDGGFRPLAVYNPIVDQPNSGKAPVGTAWGDMARRDPPFHAIATVRQDSLNTGILTDGLRAIDIDIDNPDIARRVQSVIMERLGEAPTRYRSNSPRILALYRAADGQPSKRILAGKFGKVEILGKGQQFVAFGAHYSGVDLQWMPESPAEITLDTLPAITEEDIDALFAEIAPIIEAQELPKSATGEQASSPLGLAAEGMQVVAALTAIPNRGPADWEGWNRIGMATYAASAGSDWGRASYHAWSQQNPAYDPTETNARWDHYRTSPPTQIGAGTLFYMAKQAMPAPEPGPVSASPIWHEESEWDEAAIPPRPWIVPGYLMRGAVTVLSGPGSAGKSMLTIAWAISIATGRKFSRFTPKTFGTAMIYNVEDDDDEQRRRLSAALRDASITHKHTITPADIAGRVIRIGPNQIGTLLRRNAVTNKLEETDAMLALEALMSERRPDVVFLDPFVELHDSEENDNTAVRAVMAKLRALAKKFDCAICILHHARKGIAGMAGDPDTLRGASSIVGAARVVITIMSMDELDAKRLGMDAADRLKYFRVDGAKSNYSAIGDAEWFERIGHDLLNGDTAPAARVWAPPNFLAEQSPADLNAVLDAIQEGPGGNILYTKTKKDNWCGKPLVRMLGITQEQASLIVGKWFMNGVLEVVKYPHPVHRKTADGVAVNNANRPTE